MAKKKITYKETLSKLETIITKLEGDNIDIDELSKQVKEASALVNYCRAKLRSTEEELESSLE